MIGHTSDSPDRISLRSAPRNYTDGAAAQDTLLQTASFPIHQQAVTSRNNPTANVLSPITENIVEDLPVTPVDNQKPTLQ